MSSFDFAIKTVLENEGANLPDGGFVCNKDDMGGATKGGISLNFYKTIKPAAVMEDIKALTLSQIIMLYRTYFWTPNQYEKISNQTIATYVFDSCVNHGAKQANKFLQRAIWCVDGYPSIVVDDGILGVATLSKVNDSGINKSSLYCALKAERGAFFRELASKNPLQSAFLAGWLRRAYPI